MIESPAMQQFATDQHAQKTHKIILNLLRDRLGNVPPEVEAMVHLVKDEERLDRATRLAARAPDFATFRRDLGALLAAPAGGG
jgi:hypothetical protein